MTYAALKHASARSLRSRKPDPTADAGLRPPHDGGASGATEEAPYDSSGRISCCRCDAPQGRDRDLALFTASANSSSCGNPGVPGRSGTSPDMKDIARFRLEGARRQECGPPPFFCTAPAGAVSLSHISPPARRRNSRRVRARAPAVLATRALLSGGESSTDPDAIADGPSLVPPPPVTES
jgi:hypothetical protein